MRVPLREHHQRSHTTTREVGQHRAPCIATWYNAAMDFRHVGLRRLWERGDGSRINPEHVARVNRILDDLAEAVRPADMRRPSYRLHQLRGSRRGTWSIRLSGNWRVTFRFVEGRAWT